MNVKIPGKYKIVAVYSNKANTIKFSLNNKPAAECKLPVDTGYYHQCGPCAQIGEITFPRKRAAIAHLLSSMRSRSPDKLPGNNFCLLRVFPGERCGMTKDDKPAAQNRR